MVAEDAVSGRLALGSIEEIGPATEKRLKEAGFRSIRDLLVRGPADIAEATGMEMDESVEICNKARMVLEELGVIDKSFVTATSLYSKRRDRISTGSKSFDDLLGGGSKQRQSPKFTVSSGRARRSSATPSASWYSRARRQAGLQARQST